MAIEELEVGRMCLSAGFGEIAIHWQKFSQVQKVEEYKNLTWEATLCIDDMRGSDQFVPMLPNIKCLGMGTHNTRQMVDNKLPGDARLRDYLPGPIYPTVDQWCEAGNHIKDYLPELPINYHYNINIPWSSELTIKKYIKEHPYIAIYPSSLTRLFQRGHWSHVWDNIKWSKLCRALESKTQLPIYLLGAARDQDMLSSISATGAIPKDRIVIDKPLAEGLSLIKHSLYTVGFPAGPGVLAGILNKPHCLFFRAETQKLQRGKFTDPKMLEDGRAYLPFFSEHPHVVAMEIIDRMVSLKLVNKPAPLLESDENGIGSDFINILLAQGTSEFDLRNRNILHSEDIDKESCYHPLNYPLFYALGKYRVPNKVLEIGAGKGYIAASLLSGIVSKGKKPPLYFCIDCNSLDYCSQMLRQLIQSWPFRPKLCSEQQCSNNPATRTRLFQASPFNLIILDGDSSYDGTLHDLELAIDILAPGGLVILNQVSNPSLPDIKRAYLDFCELKSRRPIIAKSFMGWGLWLG